MEMSGATGWANVHLFVASKHQYKAIVTRGISVKFNTFDISENLDSVSLKQYKMHPCRKRLWKFQHYSSILSAKLRI